MRASPHDVRERLRRGPRLAVQQSAGEPHRTLPRTAARPNLSTDARTASMIASIASPSSLPAGVTGPSSGSTACAAADCARSQAVRAPLGGTKPAADGCGRASHPPGDPTMPLVLGSGQPQCVADHLCSVASARNQPGRRQHVRRAAPATRRSAQPDGARAVNLQYGLAVGALTRFSKRHRPLAGEDARPRVASDRPCCDRSCIRPVPSVPEPLPADPQDCCIRDPVDLGGASGLRRQHASPSLGLIRIRGSEVRHGSVRRLTDA